MSIAYHILGHKNPDQVRRLLRSIYHPDDVFVLHFDRRAPRELHAVGREFLRENPGQVIIQSPRAVIWGGPEISNLQIDAIGRLLKHNQTWSYFINLTGQDFPLCRRGERMAKLSHTPEKNFISWFPPLETSLWSNVRDRLEHVHLHSPLLNLFLSTPGIGRRLRKLLGWDNRLPFVPGWKRKWPDFFRYFGGSNYVVLNRLACDYIANDPAALRIRRWLQVAAHADEIVFQSVLLSGPLSSTVVNKDFREIDFAPHSPHPRIFREADLDRLVNSRNLFARKFDETIDSSILDRLEAHLHRAGLP